MPTRFAFRQIDRRDLAMILRDGEVRSKNHRSPQHCHQTSAQQIVGFRGTPAFNLPYGGVVNDYVAFYFSPVTAFSWVIHCGGVPVIAPDGSSLGNSVASDRIFLVARAPDIVAAGLQACFSDFALNSLAPMPTVTPDFALLESHVKWSVFDEYPLIAKIPEIGYDGVCQYFHDCAVPASRQNRKRARMAELLVKDSFPASLITCIVTQNEAVRQQAAATAATFGFQGAILSKPGCFLS